MCRRTGTLWEGNYKRADVRADIAKLQTDLAWVRWIVTGGVGLYVLRSIAEWIR